MPVDSGSSKNNILSNAIKNDVNNKSYKPSNKLECLISPFLPYSFHKRLNVSVPSPFINSLVPVYNSLMRFKYDWKIPSI